MNIIKMIPLQLGNTVAQNTGQDNTEGKEGDGGDNLGQAHQQVVQLAALVARDAAHNHTDEGGDDNSDSAHGHGHAAAHNQTAEHVAAKAVGAHQVAIQAPALHLAILCDGVAAVVAGGHGSHGAVKVGDLGLAEVVVAPGDHGAVIQNNGVMIAARRNGGDMALDFLREVQGALDVVAPHVDLAVVGQGGGAFVGEEVVVERGTTSPSLVSAITMLVLSSNLAMLPCTSLGTLTLSR